MERGGMQKFQTHFKHEQEKEVFEKPHQLSLARGNRTSKRETSIRILNFCWCVVSQFGGPISFPKKVVRKLSPIFKNREDYTQNQEGQRHSLWVNLVNKTNKNHPRTCIFLKHWIESLRDKNGKKVLEHNKRQFPGKSEKENESLRKIMKKNRAHLLLHRSSFLSRSA